MTIGPGSIVGSFEEADDANHQAVNRNKVNNNDDELKQGNRGSKMSTKQKIPAHFTSHQTLVLRCNGADSPGTHSRVMRVGNEDNGERKGRERVDVGKS